MIRNLDDLRHHLNFEVEHAPRGGMTIKGRKFAGGEFVPLGYRRVATKADPNFPTDLFTKPTLAEPAPAMRETPMEAEKGKEPWQQTRKQWVHSRVNFPDIKNGGYVSLPVSHLRFGDLPTDDKGNQRPSTGYNGGVTEKGISVYEAWKDPTTGKYVLASGGHEMLAGQNEVHDRPIYVVTGETGETGSDGEPVLKPGTVKITGKTTLGNIVTEQDPWMAMDGTELEKDQTPDWSSSPDAVREEHHQLVKQAIREGKIASHPDYPDTKAADPLTLSSLQSNLRR